MRSLPSVSRLSSHSLLRVHFPRDQSGATSLSMLYQSGCCTLVHKRSPSHGTGCRHDSRNLLLCKPLPRIHLPRMLIHVCRERGPVLVTFPEYLKHLRIPNTSCGRKKSEQNKKQALTSSRFSTLRTLNSGTCTPSVDSRIVSFLVPTFRV